MLIQVSDTDWVHPADIRRVFIAKIDWHNSDGLYFRYDVIVVMNKEQYDNSYSKLFDTMDEAKKYAQGIVDKVNADNTKK